MWRARDAQVPMGHMGDAWDVANAALFLASDESKYVTGIELVVDGGDHLQGDLKLRPRRQAGATVSPTLLREGQMPPANQCQAGVMLIGQFKSFTAISAKPP